MTIIIIVIIVNIVEVLYLTLKGKMHKPVYIRTCMPWTIMHLSYLYDIQTLNYAVVISGVRR